MTAQYHPFISKSIIAIFDVRSGLRTRIQRLITSNVKKSGKIGE